MNHDFEFNSELMSEVILYNKYKYNCYRNMEEPVIIDKYERVLKARYNKVSRIKKRFIYLLSRYDYIYFCTFTFSNDYINKCTRTKRDLIKSVINTHDFKYILNIDYGKKTEREHYHCIVATNINFDVNQFFQSHYPCHCLAIKIPKTEDSFKLYSNYVNKLVNHCLKSTTKNQRIVYNFRGYDNWCPTEKDKKFFYLRDYFTLFDTFSDSEL